MKLYNTLTKKVDKLIPHRDDYVSMYTCGPTVYDYAHIGNLRTYIFEDVLEKSLEFIGYNVKRVMNITDVGHLSDDSDSGDDKMLLGAKRENKTVYEIADYYTNKFFEDFEKLNIRKPEVVDKATDNIEYYIEMISDLLNKGYAYESGGNIYFDVTKDKNYYELSGRNPDDLEVAVRDDVSVDKNKRNPFDFVLWFTSSKFDDQAMKWNSPFGVGYPGWHIECSAIAIKHLGENLDIHCGAVDLVFPHHTNEIAQSNAYLGCSHDNSWGSLWVHGEHLITDSGKMSKSDGSFLTINTLIDKGYDPLSYRFMCLNSHYRNQLVFSYDRLKKSESEYKRLKRLISKLDKTPNLKEDKLDYYLEKFSDQIKDDLNFSMMITVVYDLLKDNEVNDFSKLYLLEKFDNVLGLDLVKEESYVLIPDEVIDLVKKRDEAKKDKNYDLADKIRNKVLELGYTLVDTKDETVVKEL